MEITRSVVCGVDGSEDSHWAIRVAAELARATDTRLVLAHVVEGPPDFHLGGNARMRESEIQHALVGGGRLLERAAGTLRADTRVLIGDVADALHGVCEEQRAELLVVGSRGRSRLAAAALGSVSLEMAGTSSCPVVVVPPGAGERFLTHDVSGGSIVCGVAGSDGARILGLAESLGKHLHVPVVAVYAATRQHIRVHRRGGRHRLPLQVDIGDPAAVIRSRAMKSDARLIVVGARRRGDYGAVLLGSVSNELAAAAPVPVVVVPPSARATWRPARRAIPRQQSHDACKV
jgi:nucleotide-binding universal stress UspA family protein